MKTPLGTEVDLGEGHIVVDRDPAPLPPHRERGTAVSPSLRPMSVKVTISCFNMMSRCLQLPPPSPLLRQRRQRLLRRLPRLADSLKARASSATVRWQKYRPYCYNAASQEQQMETNNVGTYISSSTDLYFDKHRLAVELHGEMHINISTNKHRLCQCLILAQHSLHTYIHTSKAL